MISADKYTMHCTSMGGPGGKKKQEMLDPLPEKASMTPPGMRRKGRAHQSLSPQRVQWD